MADELGVQFFTTAKAQYESAGKWRLIVVAAIAYLHVALVMPFAEQMSAKSAVDRDIADYRAAESALKPVLAATKDFADRVGVEAGDHARSLRDDLVSGFSNLSGVVNGLMSLGPEAAAGEAGAALVGGQEAQLPSIPQIQMQIENAPNMAAPQFPQVQMPQMQAQQTPTQMQVFPSPRTFLPPMPSELRSQIAGGSALPGPGEVSPDFADYIETAIIAPAFQGANDTWRASVLPDLNERASRLDVQAKSAKAATQDATEELDSLAGAIADLRAEAEKLTFAPPSDPTWWWTVASKKSSIRSMTAGFVERVRNIDEQQLALQNLQAKVTEIVNQKEEAIAKISASLADLEKQAAELQSQLGELGGPLKAVNFKLALLAPLMPLIVGLTLAGIAVWTAEGLHRMSLAARLVGSDGQGRVIRTWLKSTAGNSPGRVAALELLLVILSVGWVLIAARTVSTLAVPFLTPPIILAGAVSAVVAARVYHWYRAGEALGRGLKAHP